MWVSTGLSLRLTFDFIFLSLVLVWCWVDFLFVVYVCTNSQTSVWWFLAIASWLNCDAKEHYSHVNLCFVLSTCSLWRSNTELVQAIPAHTLEQHVTFLDLKIYKLNKGVHVVICLWSLSPINCNSVGKKKHLSTNTINRPVLKYIDSLN